MNKATSKKLSSQIHQLSVQYLIVKYENDQLKEALVNEKKRRKRGKPLQLQQPEDYHGGAVFWSPTKIREARDRGEQQAYKEIKIQQQKAEAIRLREERKAKKALQLQNRKDIRASAREIRLQDQAKKKAEKEERKVTREVQKQLQNNIKSSKKGKRIASKKEPPVEPVDEAVEAVVVEYPTSSKSRSGRNINPPQRYLT
ncbi:hypothetical protein IQ07DRAFT_505322 [Pyrenochaeta sp. DS3sAY3a]|nr:hypothetical protein IQ07DRAFT_505322 [Pyrenochaeta sp. DS3sAY3a]